jgi:membrane-associated phospholipid phosphatase
LGVTLYWKISVHAAGAAGVATLVTALVGVPAVVFLPVLLVAWSRLYLRRHTLSQVVAGGLLGAVVFAALL